MTTAALIVAAGRGERLGRDRPKAYCEVLGTPMLRLSIEALRRHAGIDRTLVVIGAGHDELYRGLGDELPPVAVGGESRQESVRRGLEALAGAPPRRVLIHDAARPLVSSALLDRVLRGLDEHAAVVPALAIVDTVRRRGANDALHPVARDGLWRMQTPQGFDFATIAAAHDRHHGANLSDDAALILADGGPVHLVEGDEDNLKLTTPDDLARAERLRLAMLGDLRVGQGFDVHAFGPGDHVMLCGVAVPHEHGLVGHSDADVALHAATDAVLGALGAGDIGSHFAPGDTRWRGAASAAFLRHALDLVHRRAGALGHLDITIIGERPRIGPHRATLIASLAEITGLAPDRLSVKATTTERRGFLGRGEGLAAQAVASVRLP